MIRSKDEALKVLGLGMVASAEEIKTAYRNLVKMYHPDEVEKKPQYAERYLEVTEAYEFLEKLGLTRKDTNRVINGGVKGKVLGRVNRGYVTRSDYERFSKKAQNQAELRKEEFKKKLEVDKQKKRELEEEYNRAMKAIDAIIAAEALKAMIHDADDKKE